MESFTPRANLKRILKYRPHLRWLYYMLLIFSAALLAYFIYHFIDAYQKDQLPLNPATWFLGCVVPVILFIEGRFLVKPVAFSVIQVMPDRVLIEQGGKKTEILFKDIEKVKVSYVRSTAGVFSLILADNKIHRFTVALERSEYILEAVTSYNPSLLATRHMAAYRREAIAADHGWARVHERFKNWKGHLLRNLLLPAAVAGLVSYFAPYAWNLNPISLSILVFFFNFILGTFILVLCDLFMAHRTKKILRKNPQAVIRDMIYEKKFYFRASIIHIALFICGGIAFISLALKNSPL